MQQTQPPQTTPTSAPRSPSAATQPAQKPPADKQAHPEPFFAPQEPVTPAPVIWQERLIAVWVHFRATVRRLAQRYQRVLRRLLAACIAMVLVATIALTVAWNATPSTVGLAAWVRQQSVLHHATYTPESAIAPVMNRALVAIEDERFYQHHGIDTIGLLRAAFNDLEAGSFVEGGSTLTGQLAKNAYLGGYDHNVPLKLEDMLLAVKIEQRYSKTQILEMYLNLAYFGDGVYGIGDASQHYFGIAASHLDIAQAAMLAGLVQAPSAYDPYCHLDLATQRQTAVLLHMAADGFITFQQEQAALHEHLTFAHTFTAASPDPYCSSDPHAG